MPYPSRGDRLAGRYEIRELLGEGGMGRVYLALDRTTSAEVAVKFVRSEGEVGSGLGRRFDREIRTLQRISHPGLLAYIDHGREGDLHYLVVELLRGRSLLDALPEFRGQHEKVAFLGSRMARAVAAAHAAGIIHRDLKPANIHLTENGEPRVLDFGLAFWEKGEGSAATQLSTIEKLTVAGGLLGTIVYMSPEQMRGETVDRRTDIFSLGVVLYELAAGRRPFQGATLEELYSAITADAVPPVHEACGTEPSPASRALDAVLRTALQAPPENRFQTMLELDSALQRVLLGSQARLPQGASTAILVPPRSLVRERMQVSFAGRQKELARIDVVLREAEEGRCRFIVLTGPAGSGLSRMGDEVLREAHQQGWLALAGTMEAEDGVLGLARGWLERAFQVFPDDVSIQQALRALDGLPPGGAAGAPAHAEPLTSIVTALRGLARTVPVLAVVDCAHRLEAEELGLIAGETARPDSRFVVLALFESDAPLTVEQADAWRTVVQTEDGVAIRLGPLSGSEILQIFQDAYNGLDADPTFIEALSARSGGIPGYALELLRGLEAQEQLRRDGPDWVLTPPAELPLPPSARARLEGRLAHLEETDRSFLEAAAVLGAVFQAPRAARMAGIIAEGIEANPEALSRLTTFVEADSPSGQHRFGSELTRYLILDRLSPDRLVHWHRAAGRDYGRMATDPAQHGAAARHFLAGGSGPDALPHALEAARLHRQLGEHDRAAGWLAEALAVLEKTFEQAPEPDRPALRERLADVQFALGECLSLAGRHSEAIERIDRLRVLATELGRDEMLARALLTSARSLVARGDWLQAQRRAREASRVARRASLPAEEALASAVEAHAGSRLGDTEGIEETFQDAEKVLLEMGRSADAAEVQFRLANHHLRLQRYTEAAKCYETAASMVDSVTNPRLHAAIENGLAGVMLGRGRPAEALPRFQEAARIFERAGSRRDVAMSLHNISHCHHYLGHLSEAEASYRSVADIRSETGDLAGLAAARLNHATVLLDMGSLEEALAEAGEALAMRRRAEDLSELPIFLNPVGQIELQLGRIERARLLFLEVVQNFPAMKSESVQAKVGLAQAEWLAGRIDAARGLFEGLTGELDHQENAIESVILRYLSLRFFLEHGGSPEALRAVSTAFPSQDLSRETEEVQFVHAMGRSLLLRQDGDHKGAGLLLQNAAASAHRLGMPEWSWRIERLIASLAGEGSAPFRAAISRAAALVRERAALLRQEEIRFSYLAHRERAEVLRLMGTE